MEPQKENSGNSSSRVVVPTGKLEEKMSLRVLVGDDQIGVQGSLYQKAFLRNYKGLAEFDFESKPDLFIEKARNGRYDAFLIDLNWEDADGEREYKTGYRVLEAVKNYAPVRLLHSSENEELRIKGFGYGATDCIEKGKNPTYLNNALRGGVRK